MRTVQRWEQQAGLPVRRWGTGRGEVVNACPRELEEWERSLRQTGYWPPGLSATRGPQGASESPGQSNARRWTWRASVGLIVGAVCIGSLRGDTAPSLGAHGVAAARIDRTGLVATDEGGRALWTVPVPRPVSIETYTVPTLDASGTRNVTICDLDGDGGDEVVFPVHSSDGSREVRLLDAGGRERWVWHLSNEEAGEKGAGPVGAGSDLWYSVMVGSKAPKELWVVGRRGWTAESLLVRIDAEGSVSGAFRAPGSIEWVRPVTLDGKRQAVVVSSHDSPSGTLLSFLPIDFREGRAPFSGADGARDDSRAHILLTGIAPTDGAMGRPRVLGLADPDERLTIHFQYPVGWRRGRLWKVFEVPSWIVFRPDLRVSSVGLGNHKLYVSIGTGTALPPHLAVNRWDGHQWTPLSLGAGSGHP